MKTLSTPKVVIRALRHLCLAAWIGVIVLGIGSYIVYPQEFTAEKIAAFLLRFQGEMWLVYLVLSSLRGLTLLPSTPMVIAGTILFPTQPFAVLIVCLAGIFLSSSMIYFFSEFLGFHEYFEGHKPELTHRLKTRLERPSGFVFVALWAFFPVVPTDLVCYLAGTTAMNYWKFIGAVIAGETVLCTFYVYFGGALIDLAR